MKCEECKYWQFIESLESGRSSGDCRISRPAYPGQVVKGDDDLQWARWPETFCDEWCGEFEVKTTSDAVTILHNRYIKGSKKRLKRLEKG